MALPHRAPLSAQIGLRLQRHRCLHLLHNHPIGTHSRGCVTGDNFSWLHKKITGGKICAHVPWGGDDSCVAGKSFADYTNRWIQLGMRRPAGENQVIYYIDNEQVIDYKPSNDITSHGVLSKLYVFIQPWDDPRQTHLAETGIKIRNLEIKWD